MRDLEARQVRRYAPVACAVVVTPNDTEVRGDVQLLLRIVADDVVDRQVAIVGRRRECRRAAFDVEVRERTRAGAVPPSSTSKTWPGVVGVTAL